MNKSNKTFLSIDSSNIYYAVKKGGWEVDWEKFYNYISQSHELIYAYYYCGIESQAVYLSKHPRRSKYDFYDAKKKKKGFFKYLRELGYHVKHKPVTQVYDNTEGKFNRKCNFDVEITIDAIKYINEFNIFILVSGDGDFIPLVKYLKGNGKKVIVISHRNHSNNKLLKTANQSILLKSIKEYIKL